MELHILSLLLLFLVQGSQPVPDDRFLITAPRMFRVGVSEKVLVQMGKQHLNTWVTLYLEDEYRGIVSEQRTVRCHHEKEIKEAELMIDEVTMSEVVRRRGRPLTYLNLVATSSSFSSRKLTRVLVAKRKGHIFIQTDQPIYTPMQPVRYRIFTLDRTFRPLNQKVEISVYNAVGNRVMKTIREVEGGIYKNSFNIPSVSKMGTWRIKAHYREEQAYAASVEFKVQKFVLPSFEVNIVARENFILLGTEQFHFTISALYSHGEQVAGAYHCQFGVAEKGSTPDLKIKSIFMKHAELTGSVNGTAEVSFQISELDKQLQRQRNQTLSQIRQTGSYIYLGVFVTNVKSGEIQKANIYLPVVSQKYNIDLSRTRPYFLPGFPLDVVTYLRFPDGSPAEGVPINIRMLQSQQQQRRSTTNQEGAAFAVFNLPSADEITLEVSVEGIQQRKVIRRASSPSGSYLYMNIDNRLYSVGDHLIINFNTIGAPTSGYIYYMILSRGSLLWEERSEYAVPIGIAVRHNLLIKANMVPSFHVIGYYFDQRGNIIADSAWVDVRDECEINVKVTTEGASKPGRQSVLEFDLHGQKSKVALLAVDKAIYALHANNKLTSKKVFSTMQSNDLGCTYSGGSNPASVLTEAGLSFFTQSEEMSLQKLSCSSQSARHRRSVDLHQEMMALASNYTDEELQECCTQGFTPTPMKLTCEERARRISLVEKNSMCIEVFNKCCREGARLLQKKMREDSQKGYGRTEELNEIEDYFLNEVQYIRRHFPPSFDFTEFDINGKGSHTLRLPDSITTWEIQVVTLSADKGFCVVEPHELRVSKDVFVSLRLPYSVRRFEQLAISPVIYNYGQKSLQVAIHMEQAEGLCAPGSATTTSYVTINLEPQSSQFVTFSAVPMVTGAIPIKIRLFDIVNTLGIDAIEKTLNVLTEGVEKTDEETRVFNLSGRNENAFIIDGSLPDDTVPDSTSNIFVSAEGNGFGRSHAKNLLSPQKVDRLIILPTGCLEQTMTKLAPTASAIRYLDLSDQWYKLPTGRRDEALDYLEQGYFRIFNYKSNDGSYGLWKTTTYSNWMTALIVKVISMIAERQQMVIGQQGRITRVVPLSQIQHSVGYLLSVQQDDGSFGDPHPVLHRGVMAERERKASMTAFVTIALYRSINLLEHQRDEAEAAISRATTYLQAQLQNLQHPYSVAITAYCLAACQPRDTDHSSTWDKLMSLATEGPNDTYLWTTDASQANMKSSDALTVDATSYALLAAVQLGKTEMADKIASWLTTQENYGGGFRSSQDTLSALEALAEYELKRPAIPETRMEAEFTAPGRRDVVKLVYDGKEDRVETSLKKLTGNNINVRLSGTGTVKLKFLKAFHLLEPKGSCNKVSINVTAEGKVKYTTTVMENYDYYDDSDYANDAPSEAEKLKTAIEWFGAHTRSRRDLGSDSDGKETVTYKVCVSHSMDRNLTGMGIADITLLSGFEAVTAHLDKLKLTPERYISHYEISNGRVLLYFNELYRSEECIEFDATQEVAVGLLQPAPAVFYDYYEPKVRCTVFYSAPRRSKKVVTLCSDDVCQCAERPCHKMKNTFSYAGKMITKQDRYNHACFSPTVDYAYIVKVTEVSVKSNFELYKATVMEVLKMHGDNQVGENSVRVFANRRQCKGQLEVESQYLIMGKDGSTRDSEGRMQYLLESNTWVERNPSAEECTRSARRSACRGFNGFTREYKINGCRQ